MRKSTYINNSLFIVRMLYKDSYWLCCCTSIFLSFFFLIICFIFVIMLRCVNCITKRIYGYGPCAVTYCHCQQTPSHQCSRELLSLAACVKYKVIPSIQAQGPLSGPRTWCIKAKDKDFALKDHGQGLTSLGICPAVPKSSFLEDLWGLCPNLEQPMEKWAS